MRQSTIRNTILEELDTTEATATFNSLGRESVHVIMEESQIGQFMRLQRVEGWEFEGSRHASGMIADVYTEPEEEQIEVEAEDDPLDLF